MFRAADLDDARTVLRSGQVFRLARARSRAHGCGSVPESDRLPLNWINSILTYIATVKESGAN
jgi:hypothetical protein